MMLEVEVINRSGSKDTVFYDEDCTLWYIRKTLQDHEDIELDLIETLKTHHGADIVERFRTELLKDKLIMEMPLGRVAGAWFYSNIECNYLKEC